MYDCSDCIWIWLGERVSSFNLTACNLRSTVGSFESILFGYLIRSIRGTDNNNKKQHSLDTFSSIGIAWWQESKENRRSNACSMEWKLRNDRENEDKQIDARRAINFWVKHMVAASMSAYNLHSHRKQTNENISSLDLCSICLTFFLDACCERWRRS